MVVVVVVLLLLLLLLVLVQLLDRKSWSEEEDTYILRNAIPRSMVGPSDR